MDKTVIALSLQQKSDGAPLHPFELTKGDVQAYRLEIRIFNGDVEFNYTSAATARMVFANDKGMISTNDNGVITETGITYDVGATEISVPGRVIAAVQLLDAAGKRLTVSRFLYTVLTDPLDAGQPLPTVPEVEQLVAYIAAVEQALEDVYGGVHISGTYATYDDFIAAHPTGTAGELYLVDGSIYAWVDITSSWLNVGLIADVRTQMSITSDGGGLKLVGDKESPDDNKFYGVIGGEKGYHELPKQMSINSDGHGLKLKGDEESPADNKFYGVRSGAKGFYELLKQMSITSDDDGLKLKGDEVSPSDEKFYGVRSGAKGFYEILRPTLLWSGSWNSGDITVPNLDKYCLFIVDVSGYSANIIATKGGSSLLGSGGYYSVSTAKAFSLHMAASYLGDILTWGGCILVGHINNGNHSTYTNLSVSAIHGIA